MSDITPFKVGDVARLIDDLSLVEVVSELFQVTGTDRYVHAVRYAKPRRCDRYGYYSPSQLLEVPPSWREIGAATGWQPGVRA